jgi:hypothetical protein
MKEVKAAAEFEHLTEGEIMAALADPSPTNPTACEVARLIGCYTENFAALCERMGRIPESIVRHKSAVPIEEVAMRLTSEAIRQEVAAAMDEAAK